MRKLLAAALIAASFGGASAVDTLSAQAAPAMIVEEPGGNVNYGYVSSCGWFWVNIPDHWMLACYYWLPFRPDINYWDPFDPQLMQ